MDSGEKCDIYDKTFASSEKLIHHKKESHVNKSSKEISKMRNSGRYKSTGIATVIAIVIILVVYFSENSSSTPNLMTSVIQGISCEPSEGTVFHIHVHLNVFVNDKPITVPAGIGIKPNECLYWLHTHDASGVIHIESPQQMTFTLGQFIQVWDNTPGISPKFEELTNGDKNLQIFVNGNKVKDTYDEITLSAHDQIVIIFGAIPQTIPSSYTFGGL